MNDAYAQLIELLDERQLRYSANSDAQTATLDFACNVACHRLTLWVTPEVDLLQVFGQVSLRTPDGCRPSVAETVARINFGLRLGKFELDFDSGELRFHIAHILGEAGVTDVAADRLIGVTLQMLDQYLPAILSVIYGNEPPQAAVREAEAACQAGG